MKKKEIEELLESFVSDDERRAKFQRPWRDGDYVFASDTHIMIRVDGSMTDKQYPVSPCKMPFQWEQEPKEYITLDAFNDALNDAPLEDEVEECGENIKCHECQGTGMVYWEYEHWEKLFDCPVCDGEGYIERTRWVPTGRKIVSSMAYIQVKDKYFRADYIDQIRATMQTIGINQVGVIVLDNNSPAFFRLNNEVEIVLMPCLPQMESSSVCGNMKVHRYINKQSQNDKSTLH